MYTKLHENKSILQTDLKPELDPAQPVQSVTTSSPHRDAGTAADFGL